MLTMPGLEKKHKLIMHHNSIKEVVACAVTFLWLFFTDASYVYFKDY